jgi:hypothetical protein
MKSRTLLRALLGVIPIAMVVAAVVAGARTAGPAAAHAPDHVRHSQPVTSDEVRPADATIGQDAEPAAVPLDPAAAIAVLACLAVLAFWGMWQSSHCCSGCGYCPAWCRCDELARRDGR